MQVQAIAAARRARSRRREHPRSFLVARQPLVAFFVEKGETHEPSRSGSQTVAEVDAHLAAAHGAGPAIVFPGGFKGPLHRVDVNGGPVIAVTKLNAGDGERVHGMAAFSP